MKGYFNRENRIMQRDWEIARWQIMHFVAPYSKKKTINASDIVIFDWEKEKEKGEIKIPDRDEILDRVAQLERWEEKHK